MLDATEGEQLGILTKENAANIQRIAEDKAADEERKSALARSARARLVAIRQDFEQFYTDVLQPVCRELDAELKSQRSWVKLDPRSGGAFNTEIARAGVTIMRPDGNGSVRFAVVMADKGEHGEAGFWKDVTSDRGDVKYREVHKLPWPGLGREVFEHHLNEFMKDFILNPRSR